MRSWRFHGTGQPLVLEEVEAPRAGPGEVVVDIQAAGLCHSDVGALDDPEWMPAFPRIPMTMGHENAGVISEVGPGMEDWNVGDRVGLAPLMPDGTAIGYGAWDGGFGPRVRATGVNLSRCPMRSPSSWARWQPTPDSLRITPWSASVAWRLACGLA